MIGETVIDVISQAVAVSCIHDPTRDVTFATHSVRKKGSRRAVKIFFCSCVPFGFMRNARVCSAGPISYGPIVVKQYYK